VSRSAKKKFLNDCWRQEFGEFERHEDDRRDRLSTGRRHVHGQTDRTIVFRMTAGYLVLVVRYSRNVLPSSMRGRRAGTASESGAQCLGVNMSERQRQLEQQGK
jgi:hypothetical protein